MSLEEAAYPRRSKRKERTRAAIIAAANRLVQARGPADVTINDIAEAADVHVTTLFNHFETRGALFASLTEPDIERLEAAIVIARETMGFFEFLRAATRFAAAQYKRGEWGGIPFGPDFHSHPELVAGWLAYERRQVELLTDFAADDFGLDPETDRRPFLIATMIVSANIQIFERWQANRDGFDLAAENMAVIDAAEGLLDHGLTQN